MSDAVLYDLRDGVAYVTLNRPEAMNSADASVRTGLREAFERASSEASARAVVLTGSGRAFCVGQDLKELEPLYASGDPDLSQIVPEFNAVIAALVACSKPTVAAVNGAAAGAGMSLALACDFRVASSAASFTAAFSKIGLIPDSGATWTLPRLVGHAKALELLYLSPTVRADEALALGLVTRVASAESFADEVHAFAASLAAGPTLAYGWTRRLLLAGSTGSLDDSLELENELQTAAGRTADHQAAVTAFLSKQPPVFEGR
jgi:2-(1,2-epoxy-1,2-dihydrophenyl)acetyl-CoA isomerase